MFPAVSVFTSAPSGISFWVKIKLAGSSSFVNSTIIERSRLTPFVSYRGLGSPETVILSEHFGIILIAVESFVILTLVVGEVASSKVTPLVISVVTSSLVTAIHFVKHQAGFSVKLTSKS